MVAVVDMPISWACCMMVNHSLVVHFTGLMSFLTRSQSISAPPPGRELSPDFCKIFSTFCVVLPDFFDKKAISGGEKACICRVGKFVFIHFNISQYQFSSRFGFIPPCKSIWVPPSLISSVILLCNCSWLNT